MTDDDLAKLTSPQLAAALGITYRRVDYWIRTGHLPGVPHDTGSGQARAYTAADVRHIRALGALIDAGLTPAAAAPVALKLRDDTHPDDPYFYDLAPGIAVMVTATSTRRDGA